VDVRRLGEALRRHPQLISTDSGKRLSASNDPPAKCRRRSPAASPSGIVRSVSPFS